MADVRRLSGRLRPIWWDSRKRSQRALLFIAAAFSIVLCGSYASIHLHMAQHHKAFIIAPIVPHEQEEVSDNPEYCTTWPVESNSSYIPAVLHVAQKYKLDSWAPKGGWKKPPGIKVIGVLFAGRRRTIDILDCYLQQNLVSNGGYLDEVYFMVNTKSAEDIKWLKTVTGQTEEYSFYSMENCKEYGCLWGNLTAKDTIYIKIDDDIVYIHQDAIPRIVHTRIEHPDPFAISANIVNTMLMSYLHYRQGALHAFFPEPHANPTWPASETWRPSQTPQYPDPATIPDDYDILAMEPAFRGQRWLPVGNDTSLDMLKTPIGRFDPKEEVTGFGTALDSWALGVQQQYSLLQNLELNTMKQYIFGSALSNPSTGVSNTLWDTKYTRYNLNFVAVWGKDVRDNWPIGGDDEGEITEGIPRETGRPFVIETRALVAHFHFSPQKERVVKTDLMDRWRAFANERVCRVGNLKRPFDDRCGGY